jgi:hypothetical protein
MPEAQSESRNGANVLFHSVQTIQARFGALEADAKGRLRKALGKGHEAAVGLDEALARVSREDWSVDGMRKRFDVLRHRAENLRANALKRVAGMPGSAVSALATSSRGPVQNLARELEKLAKKLEPAAVEPLAKVVKAEKAEKPTQAA